VKTPAFARYMRCSAIPSRNATMLDDGASAARNQRTPNAASASERRRRNAAAAPASRPAAASQAIGSTTEVTCRTACMIDWPWGQQPGRRQRRGSARDVPDGRALQGMDGKQRGPGKRRQVRAREPGIVEGPPQKCVQQQHRNDVEADVGQVVSKGAITPEAAV